MKLVVDASVVAALYFPDEKPALIAGIAQRMIEAQTFAPRLFWYEIRATALKKERRGILPAVVVDRVLREIGAMPLVLRESGDAGEIMSHARRHALSFYDASYLALAIDERAQLATLDNRLAAAARAEGILFNP
ncbi:MAG TPA: type II toxin-antitoxin system VapC family toxin [Rhodoblastus sp.]|nr:type II toxin-antitoxin system VapC family toxin [Rhodoblastus sp.]